MSYTPHPIEKLVKQRILILDGAMGTMIQRYKLDEAAYRGEISSLRAIGVGVPVVRDTEAIA